MHTHTDLDQVHACMYSSSLEDMRETRESGSVNPLTFPCLGFLIQYLLRKSAAFGLHFILMGKDRSVFIHSDKGGHEHHKWS